MIHSFKNVKLMINGKEVPGAFDNFTVDHGKNDGVCAMISAPTECTVSVTLRRVDKELLGNILKLKPIVLSNLAMRFYIDDGWTKRELDEICVRGQVGCFFPDDEAPYFTLDIGSYFNLKALLEIGYVYTHKKEHEGWSDLQILTEYN